MTRTTAETTKKTVEYVLDEQHGRWLVQFTDDTRAWVTEQPEGAWN